MKQTMLSKNGSPLLDYAISKLNPEVFSHPVWVRFSNKDKPVPPETIQVLLGEAEQLRRDNPSDACQIFLVCAVYQNYSGQRTSALTTIQDALDLAERAGLSQEILWAIWGACAICVQLGNYEQASIHFGHLQTVLHEQNEWVLVDYIDVVRQSFLFSATAGPENYYNSPESQQFGPLLILTFDWLYRWGFSAQSDSGVPFDLQIGGASSQGVITRSLFPAQPQRGPWHTMKLMFRSELNLHWAKNDSPQTKSRSSLWGSVLSSLRAYLSGRKIDARIIDAGLQIPSSSTSQKATDDFLPSNSSPQREAESRKKSINVKHLLGQVTTVIPVAVHMLGVFNLTIGDLAVKLPASRGLSVLKYLLLHHKQNIPREVLMDIFWPDANPETARNNLNVAMHSLRKALRTVIFLPVIIFEDGAYSLEPNLQVWLDVEEFERCVQAGQRLESRNQLTDAVAEYETAISVYQGDFLEQNPYEEWPVLDRERLRIAYLEALDRLSQIYFSQERFAACITVCQLMLTRDRCREDTHCLLMHCYSRQGQYHLALRQYQNCVESLRAELEVEPAPETKQLYDLIRRRDHV